LQLIFYTDTKIAESAAYLAPTFCFMFIQVQLWLPTVRTETKTSYLSLFIELA